MDIQLSLNPALYMVDNIRLSRYIAVHCPWLTGIASSCMDRPGPDTHAVFRHQLAPYTEDTLSMLSVF